jgi:cation diffusion facilitator family transporter
VIWITLALNLAVALAKIAYGTLSNTIAIRADGFHSATDGINNVAGLVALWVASRPPDREHPYGHQKYEILVAALVGLSLLVMAYDVVQGAVRRSFGDAPLPDVDRGAFLVLGATLLVNLFVARYERRKGDELASPFLISDSAHTRSDVLVTIGVIVAVVLIRLGYPVFDLIAAGVVAVFIALAGIAVLRQNLGYLADTSLVAEAQVRQIVLDVPGVASTHKIRTRGTPGRIYMDLHIQIAPHLNVVQAHEVTHWVIDALKRGIDGVVDVTVHTEPAAPTQPYKSLPWDAGDPAG